MKTTKHHPIRLSLAFPDGSRAEFRIPLWKAHQVAAFIEREEYLKNHSKLKKESKE